MFLTLLVAFVNLFVPAFSAILLLRVILSYLMSSGNRLMEVLTNLTEPILAPIRQRLPQSPGIDFAPLVALLILQVFQTLIDSLVVG